MKNIGNIMKQAQQMQERMQEMQATLEQATVVGAAGAGLVQLVLTGKGEMKKIAIDKSLMVPEETEVLEDLILAAFADARRKVDQMMADETQKLTGGMKLPPGFKMPF